MSFTEFHHSWAQSSIIVRFDPPKAAKAAAPVVISQSGHSARISARLPPLMLMNRKLIRHPIILAQAHTLTRLLPCRSFAHLAPVRCRGPGGNMSLSCPLLMLMTPVWVMQTTMAVPSQSSSPPSTRCFRPDSRRPRARWSCTSTRPRREGCSGARRWRGSMPRPTRLSTGCCTCEWKRSNQSDLNRGLTGSIRAPAGTKLLTSSLERRRRLGFWVMSGRSTPT